jgi:hypothetical protein
MSTPWLPTADWTVTPRWNTWTVGWNLVSHLYHHIVNVIYNLKISHNHPMSSDYSEKHAFNVRYTGNFLWYTCTWHINDSWDSWTVCVFVVNAWILLLRHNSTLWLTLNEPLSHHLLIFGECNPWWWSEGTKTHQNSNKKRVLLTNV